MHPEGGWRPCPKPAVAETIHFRAARKSLFQSPLLYTSGKEGLFVSGDSRINRQASRG